MLRNVAVVVLNEFAPFEFGVICEVFGIDRSEEGLPVYDFAVVAGEPGPVRSRNDFTIQPRFGLERLAEADLIARARHRRSHGSADVSTPSRCWPSCGRRWTGARGC